MQHLIQSQRVCRVPLVPSCLLNFLLVELNIVRDLLIQRLGPDFARSAIGNRDNHVPSRVSTST